MDSATPAKQFDVAFRDEDLLFELHRSRFCHDGHVAGVGERKPGCTVVVCTYRRAASLARFLYSLGRQDAIPEALVIVDASPDEETQVLLSRDPFLGSHAACVLYFRVRGRWKGLTRQRNFAVRWVRTDLLAFFDDDVVLMPGCLAEMKRVHRTLGPAVLGVGAIAENERPEPRQSPLWRLRRKLRIVPTLEPGRYFRSGMSTPWGALPPDRPPLEGDWLPGCGMMWKTATVAELGFNDAFEGYSQGEDLDFSLRARQKGRLIMAPAARLLHLQDASGRPDDFKLGYSAIYNRYEIHCRGLLDRDWLDVLYFTYAWLLDTILLLRNLVVPQRLRLILNHLRGRFQAAYDLLSRQSHDASANEHLLSSSLTRRSFIAHYLERVAPATQQLGAPLRLNIDSLPH